MSNIALEGFQLSPQQKHLWASHHHGPSQTYCVQCAILLEGNLNEEGLREAIQQVVKRHEILRTTFHRRPGMKTPFQIVSDKSSLLWEQVDLQRLSADEKEAATDELFQQKIHKPFDFEHGPLLRASLITQLPDRHVLIISLPALCADTWTLKNLIREIGDAYAACLHGEKLSDAPLQYADYSAWHNELLETEDEDAEKGKAFWRKQDNSSLPDVVLPFEFRTDQTPILKPVFLALAIDPEMLARIDEISAKNDTSAAIYLLACWQALLRRLSGQSDIVVGHICDGRKYQEFRGALGPFSRLLPIPCSFQGKMKFSESLKQLRESTSESDEWQEYFRWEQSPHSAGTVLSLPIGFEFEDRPAKYSVADLSFSIYRLHSWTEPFKIKLCCVRVNELLMAEFYYDPALFRSESIQRIAGHFSTLLKSTTENPDALIEELDVLRESERHQVLVEFNQTAADYPQDKCIHELFEEQVARTPDGVAVVCGDQKLSYADLNARANQLAHLLRGRGVSPDVPVGLCVDRSVQMLVGLLGILKAGGAYVPLNPDHPKARLAHELIEIQSPVLVTQESLLSRIPDFSGEVICLDTHQALLKREPTINPKRLAEPQNLVYVIYTSGSTGIPKGVAVTHQSLVNYTHFISKRLHVHGPSKSGTLHFAVVSTISADLGNTCIFPSLTSGGCLHIISYDVATEGNLFGDYVSKHSIDVLKIVPSHLGALLAAQKDDADILPRKWLILGGEALSLELADQISKRANGCKVINHYGPTEATVGSLTFSYEEQNNSPMASTVPIGRPIANTEVYMLDQFLNPVPVGVTGQLYIGGDGLARCYLDQPEQTAERFISNPFSNSKSRLYKTGDLARFLPDGNVEFLGRVDHQVKIRGFRVELGEIEAVLTRYPSIRQSVVVASEAVPGDVRLIAYVVARESIPNLNELRSWLRDELPDYMVPSAFVMLKAMPLTPNGKVDRNALPKPGQAELATERVFVAPRSPNEEIVARIWAEVLRADRIGIHENFFDLGGHSLLVTQVIARLRRAFEVEIPLRWLFESPTVAEMAERIGIIEQQETSRMLAELEYLSDEEALRLLDLERSQV